MLNEMIDDIKLLQHLGKFLYVKERGQNNADIPFAKISAAYSKPYHYSDFAIFGGAASPGRVSGAGWVWSGIEFVKLVPKLWPHITKDQIQARFETWNGWNGHSIP